MPQIHKGRLTKYESWMPEKLRAHMADGWSMASFPAKYNIDYKFWPNIVRSSPEMLELKKYYLAEMNKKKSYL